MPVPTGKLTSFANALRAELEADFAAAGEAVRFRLGRIDGPVRNQIGCVFQGSLEELPENVQTATVACLVRVLQAAQLQRDPEVPLDLTKLSDWGEFVMVTLADKGDVPGALAEWFCRPTGYVVDPEVQHVEITVVGWVNNPFDEAA